MKENNEDKTAIRRLMLGDLSEEEQQRIEERFITDDGYRESVLMEENELIEDYLEGALPEHEMKKFRARFLSTPTQRRKVKIARALKKYAEVESAAHSPPAVAAHTEHTPWWRALFGALKLRSPLVYLPVGAALALILVFGAIRLVDLRRANELRAREAERRLQDERELQTLNDPANPGSLQPGTTLSSVVLSPVSVRGVGAAPRLDRADPRMIVELRLLRGRDEFRSYRATLQRVGDGADVPLPIPGLRFADTPDGKVVTVKIPARILTRGAYRLTLSGVNADGMAEVADEYAFEIID